ncbi:FAD-binding oxidoreductase [Candidatus Pacearchaeota archaeon]|nr:FAD-binding oxidoreductase [Candidatus Pacearchaeota archaeon]
MAKDNVIVVGGGLSGLSAAYHLAKQGIKPVVVEAGKIGIGTDDMLSGTNGPTFSKMITTEYETDAETFYEKIGKEKSRRFLKLAKNGADLQVQIAKSLDSSIVREDGTIIVGHGVQKSWLEDEVAEYPTETRKNCRPVSIDGLVETYGLKRTAFDGGVFMPNDATIDCNKYIQLLAREVERMGGIILEGVKVTGLKSTKQGVKVSTDKSGDCNADYVVMATNGFFIDSNLKGLLKPKWSYILSYEDKGKDTPNSWDFTDIYHYWLRTGNVLSVGGEDKSYNFDTKYSRASKLQKQALEKLDAWAKEKFPALKGKKPIAEHYGVFVMTPDEMPIVGNVGNVFYLVGCNGSGQSTLSYGAYLLPGLMGYRKLSEEEKKFAELLSINRPSLKVG